ncbi:MAG TPA: hypothetical protein VF427_15685 [Noviherbaspirillum sp.]
MKRIFKPLAFLKVTFQHLRKPRHQHNWRYHSDSVDEDNQNLRTCTVCGQRHYLQHDGWGSFWAFDSEGSPSSHASLKNYRQRCDATEDHEEQQATV